MLFTGINVNRKWKIELVWSIRWCIYSSLWEDLPQNTHARARAAADTGRFLPGPPEFKNAFSK
jgi:hypothetical protein